MLIWPDDLVIMAKGITNMIGSIIQAGAQIYSGHQQQGMHKDNLQLQKDTNAQNQALMREGWERTEGMQREGWDRSEGMTRDSWARDDRNMQSQWAREDNAHQRQVADLKEAGLNPILSAGGQGAGAGQVLGGNAPQFQGANMQGIQQQAPQEQGRGAFMAGIANASMDYIQRKEQQAHIDHMKAQDRHLKAQTRNMDAETDYLTGERTLLTQLESRAKKIDNDFKELQNPLQLSRLTKEIESIGLKNLGQKLDNSYKVLQKELTRIGIDRAGFELMVAKAEEELRANIRNMEVPSYILEQTINAQRLLLVAEQIKHLKWQQQDRTTTRTEGETTTTTTEHRDQPRSFIQRVDDFVEEFKWYSPKTWDLLNIFR